MIARIGRTRLSPSSPHNTPTSFISHPIRRAIPSTSQSNVQPVIVWRAKTERATSPRNNLNPHCVSRISESMRRRRIARNVSAISRRWSGCGGSRTESGMSREPMTTSKPRSSHGSSLANSSIGTARSASHVRTVAPLPAKTPVRTAAPLPRFRGWVSTRTDIGPDAVWATTSRVASVLPSSTMINSHERLLDSAHAPMRSMVRPIRPASFSAGMTIVRSGVALPPVGVERGPGFESAFVE